MTAQTLQVKGLKETRRALYAFGGKFGDKVVKKSLRVGLKVIQRQARANAPVKTGRLKRAIIIKNSKLFNGRRNRQIGLFLTIRQNKTKASPTTAFYGRFLEDGWNVRGKSNGRRALIVATFGSRTGRKSAPGKRNISGRRFIHRAFTTKKVQAVRRTVAAAKSAAEILKRKEGFR